MLWSQRFRCLIHRTVFALTVVSCGALLVWKSSQLGLIWQKRLLDRRLLFYKSSPDIRETDLHLFEVRDLVYLLDYLADRKTLKRSHPPGEVDHLELIRYNETKRYEPRRTLHVAFVGDSRTRQLFDMLFQTLPPNDLRVYPAGVERTALMFIPNQMIVYSELLRTIVSFNWYNLLVERDDKDVFTFFKTWLGLPKSDENSYLTKANSTPIQTPHPDILVTGISLHHMLQKYRPAQERVYVKKLRDLIPLLRSISKHSQIVWLSQYPTVEMFGRINDTNTDVHSQKIWHYNQVANRILRDAGIPVWDSGSPIVEEGIRSCLLNKRKDGYYKGYFSCTDYVHPGISAVMDIEQILYNIFLPRE